MSTLRFANRAKEMKTKPTVNMSDEQKLIKELKAKIEELMQSQNTE